MPAVTIAQMIEAETAAFASGWTEEQVLDLAGERLGHAIARHFPEPGTAVAYLGKGHNAADALVALRILRDHFGWITAARTAFPIGLCAPLTQAKWRELALAAPLRHVPAWRDTEEPLILLDALLGSGAKGALRDPLLSLAAEMQWLREHTGARVAAVDLPSGIDADTGHPHPASVTADITFMIGNPKRGLLSNHAANHCGALALVPVECLSHPNASAIDLISPQTHTFGKRPRPFDFHKGMSGRVSLVAGSATYPGAAVLAATGALRGGAGLVTLHVPHDAAAVIAAKCPPEIIIRSYHSPDELHDLQTDALVIGPGLGTPDPDASQSLIKLIANRHAPAVIDADALNLIARQNALSILHERHILTPHPGEFQRLAPDLAHLPREQAARAFADRHPATLLLKGSRTLVTRVGNPLWANSTGTPGMATGGQGDLLAGLIAARLAIGDPPVHAAALCAWICGRAAELALLDPRLSKNPSAPRTPPATSAQPSTTGAPHAVDAPATPTQKDPMTSPGDHWILET